MKRWLLDSNAVGAMLSHHQALTTMIARAQTNGIRIGTCEPVDLILNIATFRSEHAAAEVTSQPT